MDVEILDVNDAEAKALLLSIDPLAALAQTHAETHRELLERTPTDEAELRALWRQAEAAHLAALTTRISRPPVLGAAQFLVIVTCRDEQQQSALIERFLDEGLECRALLG